MKMHKRFPIKNNIAIYIICVYATLLIACNYKIREASIGYGYSIFEKKCLGCHTSDQGADNGPSMRTLNRYGNAELIEKLGSIKADSLHAIVLNSQEYSTTEINSIKMYIRDYFKMRY